MEQFSLKHTARAIAQNAKVSTAAQSMWCRRPPSDNTLRLLLLKPSMIGRIVVQRYPCCLGVGCSNLPRRRASLRTALGTQCCSRWGSWFLRQTTVKLVSRVVEFRLLCTRRQQRRPVMADNPVACTTGYRWRRWHRHLHLHLSRRGRQPVCGCCAPGPGQLRRLRWAMACRAGAQHMIQLHAIIRAATMPFNRPHLPQILVDLLSSRVSASL
jgi:hypothetical protein